MHNSIAFENCLSVCLDKYTQIPLIPMQSPFKRLFLKKYLPSMKSEYFTLLPNDLCCSLQSFAAISSKKEKLTTENLSQLNAPVLMTEPP